MLQTLTRPEPLWFIDTLAHVHISGEETDGRYTVVENLAAAGNMPPLHAHGREDEVFHVLDGLLTLFLPGAQVDLTAGQTFRVPEGAPHTYRVESETARWLVVCQPAGFDSFVCDVSRPAADEALPPRDLHHDLGAIAAAAERHGITLLGPPGALPG